MKTMLLGYAVEELGYSVVRFRFTANK